MDGNSEKISPQAKNTRLDNSTNITGLLIVYTQAQIARPSIRKAVNMAFSRPIWSEIQPQSGLVPFEGYLIDRLGPRLVIGIGGLLVGAGRIGSGYATTTTGLYIWYAIGGIGAGAVYGGCTGFYKVDKITASRAGLWLRVW
jgi:MFS family permease